MTLIALNSLGLALRSAGRFEEALPLFQESLDLRRRVVGEDHPYTHNASHNLALILQSLGRLREAETYYRIGLDGRLKTLGPENPMTMSSMASIGGLLTAQQRPTEAEPLLRQAYRSYEQEVGSTHPETLRTRNSLANTLRALGKLEEAEFHLREVLIQRKASLGAAHADTLRTVLFTAWLRNDQQRHAEAVALLLEWEPAARAAFTGSAQRSMGSWLLRLGQAQRALGKHEQAEARLLDAFDLLMANGGGNTMDLKECAESLGQLYQDWERVRPGQGHAADAAFWQQRLPGIQVPG